MENIKILTMPEYFKILGWQTTDLIGIGIGSNGNKDFRRKILSIGDVIQELEANPIKAEEGKNHYYSVGVFQSSSSNAKQENVKCVSLHLFEIKKKFKNTFKSLIHFLHEKIQAVKKILRPEETFISICPDHKFYTSSPRCRIEKQLDY